MSQVSRKGRFFRPPGHRSPPDQVRSITWLDSGSDAAGTTTVLRNNPRSSSSRTVSSINRRRTASSPTRPPAARPPQQQWPQQGAGGHGEPEYFDPYGHQHPQAHPQQPPYGHGGGAGGSTNDNPGHTQVFAVGEDPYGQGATYQAGAAAAPAGPRLPWKELLRGIVTRPGQTFLQMRDYPVWAPR